MYIVILTDLIEQEEYLNGPKTREEVLEILNNTMDNLQSYEKLEVVKCQYVSHKEENKKNLNN